MKFVKILFKIFTIFKKFYSVKSFMKCQGNLRKPSRSSVFQNIFLILKKVIAVSKKHINNFSQMSKIFRNFEIIFVKF